MLKEWLKYINGEESVIDKWWRSLYRRYGNVAYWFRGRFIPKHMHHVIWTDLESGWHDVDHVMLHACFGLLCRYVEDEYGGIEKLTNDEKYLRDEKQHGQLDNGCYNPPEMMIAQADNTKEIIELYNWWKYVKPANEIIMDDMIKNNRYHEYNDLRDKADDEEQKMLHRLIDVRRSLWT